MIRLRTYTYWYRQGNEPTVCYKDSDYILPTQAGKDDNIDIFIMPDDPYHVLALVTNPALGYAGLEYYRLDPGQKEATRVNDCFILNPLEGISEKFFDYSEIYQAKILYEYLPY